MVLFTIFKNYIFQNKGDSVKDSSTLYNNNMDDDEEEEEEVDDEEEENDNVEEKGNEEDANVHKSECKKSIPHKDETESNDNMKTDDKPYMRSIDQETRKQNVNAADDKKRKKDSKSEKSKNIKKQYDQDVHSEDYSTWVPPQNQSGDGRTNLNDKYGY